MHSQFSSSAGGRRALALAALLAGSLIAGCGGTESSTQTGASQRAKITAEPAFLSRQCDQTYSPHLSCPGA